METTIFRCQFGSHIYGTNLPTSDLDYKAIFLPSPRDLVLQRAPKHIENNTKKNSTERNTAQDIDDESFSIQEYLKLLCQGQTMALDMLFTPKEFIIYESDRFHWLKLNKDKFLHKGTSAFVGYTRAQAAKYGVKGFRVSAIRSIVNLLADLPPASRLEDHITTLLSYSKLNEHINIVDIRTPRGELVAHLDVCNRKVGLNCTVKYAYDIYKFIFDKYGERAKLAEKNEGIDWKALMHAVRVAREAEELLTTSNITFPRPERELLLKIRKGELPYKEVETLIESGLERVETAQKSSHLPEEPNWDFVEEFIYLFHLKAINSLSLPKPQ